MSARKKVPGVVAEPPHKRPMAYDWPALAQWLTEHPGTWRKVFDDGKISVVNALRQGSIKALRPSLGFEVSTRNNKAGPPRTCTLYVRYVPPEET